MFGKDSSMATKPSKEPGVDIATPSPRKHQEGRPSLVRTSSKSKPIAKDTRYRGWCITDNNYVKEAITLYTKVTGVLWGIMGQETGKVDDEDEEGTPHLQGYMYTKYNITLSAMKKRIYKATKRNPHIEPAGGTAEQSLVYCSKEDKKPLIWGTMPKQGKRTDLIKLKQDLDNVKLSTVQVWNANFSAMIKYHKGAAKYKMIKQAAQAGRWRRINVTLIMGPTGVGKTKMALYDKDLNLIPDTYLIHGSDLGWWDGYERQSRLVIDEYANNIKITDLLSLLDGNKKRLNVKHSFGYAGWKTVVITTNLMELHEKAKPAHKDALQRRITRTINLWTTPVLQGITLMGQTYPTVANSNANTNSNAHASSNGVDPAED